MGETKSSLEDKKFTRSNQMDMYENFVKQAIIKELVKNESDIAVVNIFKSYAVKRSLEGSLKLVEDNMNDVKRTFMGLILSALKDEGIDKKHYEKRINYVREEIREWVLPELVDKKEYSILPFVKQKQYEEKQACAYKIIALNNIDNVNDLREVYLDYLITCINNEYEPDQRYLLALSQKLSTFGKKANFVIKTDFSSKKKTYLEELNFVCKVLEGKIKKEEEKAKADANEKARQRFNITREKANKEIGKTLTENKKYKAEFEASQKRYFNKHKTQYGDVYIPGEGYTSG